MTRDDIDRLLNACQTEAAKGDPEAVPGAIYLNSGSWIGLPMAVFPTTCVSPGVGIRYRGVRVLISSQFEDKVASRAECGDAGLPFYDLEPSAD
jgi:hypothetical protein